MLRRLRSQVWQAGRVLRRGFKRDHPDPSALVPGMGDTRFAPLPEAHHVYLAAQSTAALLESAFHDAQPPRPRIREAQLGQWAEAAVSLRRPIRLIDLRDDELTRLGIARATLVATDALHYPCTRSWAVALRGRTIGGEPTQGLVWHSRQHELHARAMTARPAVHDLLTAVPAEVAVVWAPPAPRALLDVATGGLGPLDTGDGLAYVTDLAALLRIPII